MSWVRHSQKATPDLRIDQILLPQPPKKCVVVGWWCGAHCSGKTQILSRYCNMNIPFEPKGFFSFSGIIALEVFFSCRQGFKYQQSLKQQQIKGNNFWQVLYSAVFWCLQITSQIITSGQSTPKYSWRAFINEDSGLLCSIQYIFWPYKHFCDASHHWPETMCVVDHIFSCICRLSYKWGSHVVLGYYSTRHRASR